MQVYSHQQTLQQLRARHAWDDVSKVVGQSYASEYGSLVRSLPASIQSDGLAPALAFLKAKGKTHHLLLYGQVSRWVMHRLTGGNERELLDWVLDQPSTTYRIAANETQAYLGWLKRFSEASNLG